jgi:CheY-specific phosphatase CheX
MNESALRKALAESLDDVLEKMFFIRCFGEPGNHTPEPAVIAHLNFDGDPPGWLTLRVTAAAARSVAADFLGEDELELSERQIGEVVCELANMVCGSVLSRVESNTAFRLAAPRIVASAENLPAAPETAAMHAAEIDNGAISVIFNTEAPAWSIAEKHVS